jgi:beta-glucosidase
MASVSKQIKKSSKLRKTLLTSTLALSLLAPIMVPQVNAADNGGLGQHNQEGGNGPGAFAVDTVQTTVIPATADQAGLEAANANRILDFQGKKFRDINGNNKVDDFEDWRKPVSERVASMVAAMTLEQKAGLIGIREFPAFKDGKLVLPNTGIDAHSRYFIYRNTPSADIVADYNNQLQKAAEESVTGLPIVVISNPRNHASTDYTNGTAAAGQHSFWPGQLGFAAAGDSQAVKEFAEYARAEWRAAGIRKIYGYTADIATDPLWARIEDTFGENPEVAGDMIYNIVKGFQGDTIGKDSVTITTKHFPGGGARDDGTDPHFENGNFNPYPTEGSLLKYHIPPFKKAIEAGTASIMPYYAYPSNEHSADQGLPWYQDGIQQFEQIAFALNDGILGFLRAPVEEGGLGFKGYVNSDTGAIGGNAWGAEGMTNPEKAAKALKAGTDIFSGYNNPEYIVQAVEQNLIDEAEVDESVSRLLTEMISLGLFEDPYVDPQNALDVFATPEAHAKAYKAHQKSVALLRNDKVHGEKILPLKEHKVKLYVEGFVGATAARGAADPAADVAQKSAEATAKYNKDIKALIKEKYPEITLVDKLEDATAAYVYVKPVQSNWDNNPRITVGPETSIFGVDRIVEIQKTVPTITAVNMTNPWILDEIEPNTAAFINVFGTRDDAILDVITGKFNPVGKLPFALPASVAAVEQEVGDVPSYAKEEYANYSYVNKAGDKYEYGFGLSYNQGKAVGKPDHAVEKGKPAHAQKNK